MKINTLLSKKETLHFLWIGVFLSLLFSIKGSAQELLKEAYSDIPKVSETPDISFLFNTPIEGEVYSIYGHIGVRVTLAGKEDYVYNYGVFDFDAPNFILNFVTGKMDDYRLDRIDAMSYIESYLPEASMYELKLNLSADEAQKMKDFLEHNIQPENAYYRYNFIFDNCSTRPFEVLKKVIDGHLKVKECSNALTRREMLDLCNSKRGWYKLGTDLTLGSQADQKIGVEEQAFLPLYLMEMLRSAQIVSPDGKKRPLVRGENFYPQGESLFGGYLQAPDPLEPTPMVLTPSFVFTAVAVIMLLFLLLIRKKQKLYWHSSRYLLALLFLAQGVTGCILFFLTFISLHPLVSPNWNLLSLNPLHLLIGIPFVLFLPRKRATDYALWLNVVGQVLYLILVGIVGLQTSHPALIVVALTSLLLSINIILCKRKVKSHE